MPDLDYSEKNKVVAKEAMLGNQNVEILTRTYKNITMQNMNFGANPFFT